MLKIFLPIFLLLANFSLQAQPIPKVPSRIRLANMDLIIDAGGRQDIQKDVNSYRKNDKNFRAALDRYVLYMPIVERVLKEEKVPDELKYLCIQESGLLQDAVSSSKAVGFWQFKYASALEVGMRVDRHVDERKNIVSSTRGAARYFKSHNKKLDNWANTVLAHMTGMGGIQKIANKKDVGAKRMMITRRSHWYLKRYLAHKIAYENELHHTRKDHQVLGEYTNSRGKSLSQVAKALDIDIQVLQSYNKWLSSGKVPNDKNYTIIYPTTSKNLRRATASKSNKANKREEDLEEDMASQSTGIDWEVAPDQTTEVRINELPAVRAGKFDSFTDLLLYAGVKEKKLLKWNEIGGIPTVKPGQVFYLKKKRAVARQKYHIAKYGETLYTISQRYGVRLKSLAIMNRMSIIDDVAPGRVMWLNAKRPATKEIEIRELPKNANGQTRYRQDKTKKPLYQQIDTSPKTKGRTSKIGGGTGPMPPKVETIHRVARGETLWGISKKYGVGADDIQMWNNMRNNNLQVGQELKIIKYRQIAYYTVEKGDNLTKIAKSLGIDLDALMKLNEKKTTRILVGEQLKYYE